MFDNFETFGSLELDLTELFGVLWEWEQGTITLPSGLTDYGDTEKLEAVVLLFKTGQQMKISGRDAKVFREWWVAMNHTVGEVA